MIKFFKADPMYYTPFANKKDIKFLNDRGIFMTDDELDCDIFVAGFIRQLLPYRIKYRSQKQYLVWTFEPRIDTHFNNKVDGILFIPDVHIMNVYTGNIYLNNYTLCYPVIDRRLESYDEVNFPKLDFKKTVALMYYRNDRIKWSLKKEGKERDLCYLRTQIALQGYKFNQVDIYGKGWPKNIALEDSRDGQWQQRKAEVLKKYHFNLCFENTNMDYYCTEKIWDSIKFGCLPIYYGDNNKIYEDFPKNSFLDYCSFKNPQDLFKYIDDMDASEFRTRMNLCIAVFNEVYEKLKFDNPYEEMLLKIVQKAKEITKK